MNFRLQLLFFFTCNFSLQFLLGRAQNVIVIKKTTVIKADVESSRTHFEVFGLEGQVLGLEVSSTRKLPCPLLEDSTIFSVVKSLWSALKFFWKTFLLEIAEKSL